MPINSKTKETDYANVKKCNAFTCNVCVSITTLPPPTPQWASLLIFALSLLLRSALLLSSVWTRSDVCSLDANPFNARFHPTLLKPAAQSHLCNLDLL